MGFRLKAAGVLDYMHLKPMEKQLSELVLANLLNYVKL